MLNKSKVIDAHVHIGFGRRKKQSSEQLIQTMDELGVDLAVICPVDEHIAVTNVEGNNQVIKAVQKYPDRLIGMAVANPWYGDRALEELKRALDAGLRGLKINASLQGHWVDDEMMDPLIDLVKQYKGHVYVHSGTPDYSMPYEICELADRHPDVNFIMGHSGNIDVFWEHSLASGIKPGLKNVFYDPSHITFLNEIKDFVTKLGADKVIFASDSPAGSMKLEMNKLKIFGFDDKTMSMILGGNMERILGL